MAWAKAVSHQLPTYPFLPKLTWRTSPGLSCANNKALRDRVAPLFSASKSFTPYVVPKAGHDTNLHYNAPVMFAAAQVWTKCHIDKKWCLPLE